MTDQHVCPPDHDHAIDTVCYLHHGCRDQACRDGMALRQRERRAAIANGTYARGRVAAQPVRERLAWLRAQGLGIVQIEAATRVPRIVLSGLCWGAKNHAGIRQPRQRVAARYARRILELEPTLDMFADAAKIPATGSQRRLQALGCLGWTYAAIARHSGLTDRRVAYIAHAPKVTARLARVIAATYDELWNTPPTARTIGEQEQIRRTIRRAHNLGWAPPLAWDDIDHDDAPQQPEPATDVDIVAIDLALTGRRTTTLTVDERHEVVRQLNARLYFDTEIALMTGVSVKTIERDRATLGIPAVDPIAREHATDRPAPIALAA